MDAAETSRANLIAIRTEPQVAIGQSTYLVRTPEGNVLWDCISYLDDETIEAIKGLGGVKAIAISHPHFFATNIE
jgi:glyoxylase-like metal-dependent hydrolase (beta-lactamase superfamily II)